MGNKKQLQIKLKQQKKRLLRRRKLAKEGKNPDEVFYGKTWVGPRQVAQEAA
jgi:hypothetical protein